MPIICTNGTNYNLLKAKVSNVKQRPSVFSGEMRRDTWYVPGGQKFLCPLVSPTPGADYFMKDNPETGGVLMDFETVYCQGYQYRLLESDEWL